MACSKSKHPLPRRSLTVGTALLASLAVLLGLACSRVVENDQPCRVDRECEGERLCILGECVLHETQCLMDEDCPDGEICEQRRCEDGHCGTDCDCSVDSACLHGRCSPDSIQCYADADCRICQAGFCTGTAETCANDEDCPYAFCVQEDTDGICGARHCVEPRCRTDEDCTEAETICLMGECRAPACYYDYQCNLLELTNGVCSMWRCTEGVCASARDCESYELCIHGFCQTRRCETQSDCPSVSACFPDGFCRVVSCIEDTTACPDGSGCGKTGVCTPLQCRSDADCFPLEVCSDGFCRFSLVGDPSEKRTRSGPMTRRWKTSPTCLMFDFEFVIKTDLVPKKPVTEFSVHGTIWTKGKETRQGIG